ncbi:MAG: 50S ribosomal protein L5 [Patescibacteria group bacterium]
MSETKHKISYSPRGFLEKVVINAGVGKLSNQPNFEEKILPGILSDIATITGQKAKINKARKSIAGFKIRQNQIVGLSVTLRRKKMVDFFERLTKIVLPRVRDFVGIDLKSIDKNGILNIGLKEQYVFPEINTDKSTLTFSLGINIVPKLKTRKMAEETYRELGVPLKKVKK